MISIAGAHKFKLYPLSECAVTIEFASAIDEGTMGNIRAFDLLLNQRPFPGMYQTVAAYTTLTVFFDPPALFAQNQLPGINCYEKVRAYLHGLANDLKAEALEPATETVSIPVCYGHEFGPDLEYVAKYHELTIDEVVRLHSSGIYKVHMIGFVPGFSYMGGLDDALETPRKPSPVKVPAGAVGIAGKQTGIYPLEIPGGWQIIGQTPLKLFDAGREQPALLKAGDRVKFEAIGAANFKKYSAL